MGLYAMDCESREDTILRYLPLVKFIASRIAIGKMSPVDSDDLINYGVIGLIDAIDKFDPKRGVKFETYASLRIKGAIIDELRKISWMPRSAMGKVTRLNEVREELKEKLGRDPKNSELSEALDLPIEDLQKIEGYVNYLSVVSLDEIIFHSDDDDIFLSATIEDVKSPRPEMILEDKEKMQLLKKSIEMLNEKDKLVLSLYYYEKLTLKEIGQIMSISESRVSQLHSRVILRLRDNLKKLKYQ
ncbi:RNA polymerase sigma-D factor [Oxobacter pfennigii]|uniref:RNA polymerase sigma-D factor n=2 Tax=Oxobacter pfennigii TaxID=36849 RepID=A0A0P8WQ88_9CLOT|nr:RNA polymerase sigma-D factor [Oxobacter pfennigii]